MANEEKVIERIWVRDGETNPELATGRRYVETSTTYKLKGQPSRNLMAGDLFSEEYFTVDGLIARFGEQRGKEYADLLVSRAAAVDIQRVSRALLKRVASGDSTPEEEFAAFPEEYTPGMKLTSTNVEAEDVFDKLASLSMKDRVEQLKVMMPHIAANEKLIKQLAEGYSGGK